MSVAPASQTLGNLTAHLSSPVLTASGSDEGITSSSHSLYIFTPQSSLGTARKMGFPSIFVPGNQNASRQLGEVQALLVYVAACISGFTVLLKEAKTVFGRPGRHVTAYTDIHLSISQQKCLQPVLDSPQQGYSPLMGGLGRKKKIGSELTEEHFQHPCCTLGLHSSFHKTPESVQRQVWQADSCSLWQVNMLWLYY